MGSVENLILYQLKSNLDTHSFRLRLRTNLREPVGDEVASSFPLADFIVINHDCLNYYLGTCWAYEIRQYLTQKILTRSCLAGKDQTQPFSPPLFKSGLIGRLDINIDDV